MNKLDKNERESTQMRQGEKKRQTKELKEKHLQQNKKKLRSE